MKVGRKDKKIATALLPSIPGNQELQKEVNNSSTCPEKLEAKLKFRM